MDIRKLLRNLREREGKERGERERGEWDGVATG
jgi:hypothetical protein